MEDRVFERFREIIHKESGISLSSEKKQLLENRIRKRIRAMQLGSEEEYLHIIETDVSSDELINLIDVISTNHTSFFREIKHFEFLREWFKNRDSRDSREVKIWCAASSSGEEPYTIALTAAEALGNQTKGFRLLATDICTQVLEKAIRGIYPAESVASVPPALRAMYFDSLQIHGDSFFRVKPELAKTILFKKFNLAKFPYPLKGGFDLVFCRNVMIYFQDDLRTQLVGEIYKLLKPGGYLIVGHSESLARIKHPYEMAGSSIYRKPGH